MPDRSSINPGAIPYRYLPNLFLYEREPDGRFRCKLIGTNLERVLGRDDTGQHLDEALDPSFENGRSPLFEQAVATGRPVYYRYRAIVARGEWREFANILLPVSSGRGEVDHVFGMAWFGPTEYEVGRRALLAVANGRASEVIAATEEDLADLATDGAEK